MSPFVISVLAVILLGGGIVTLWSAFKGRLLASIMAPGIAFAVAFLFVAMVVFPKVNEFKSSREFAEIIADETAASVAAGHEVVAFDLGNLPVHYAFYTNGLYTIETKRPQNSPATSARTSRSGRWSTSSASTNCPPIFGKGWRSS